MTNSSGREGKRLDVAAQHDSERVKRLVVVGPGRRRGSAASACPGHAGGDQDEQMSTHADSAKVEGGMVVYGGMTHRLILMPMTGPDAPPAEAGQGSAGALLAGRVPDPDLESLHGGERPALLRDLGEHAGEGGHRLHGMGILPPDRGPGDHHQRNRRGVAAGSRATPS